MNVGTFIPQHFLRILFLKYFFFFIFQFELMHFRNSYAEINAVCWASPFFTFSTLCPTSLLLLNRIPAAYYYVLECASFVDLIAFEIVSVIDTSQLWTVSVLLLVTLLENFSILRVQWLIEIRKIVNITWCLTFNSKPKAESRKLKWELWRHKKMHVLIVHT